MSDTRRRAADPDGFDDIDDLVRRFDAGESIISDDDEIVEINFKVPLDMVVPVRLTGDVWRALHREAKELGVGPTTLARMWIMEKLRAVEAGRKARRVGEEREEYVATPRKNAAVRKPAAKRKAAARRRTSK